MMALATRPAQSHTPYSQWQVYRQKHLLIGCHRQDLETYKLAQNVVAVLDSHLPAAKARVARAPHPQRLASLLGTDQLQFSILDLPTLFDMIAGRDKFKPYGQLELQVLWRNQRYVLAARAEVPARHGWLVAAALDEGTVSDTVSVSSSDEEETPKLNWHNGATIYRRGQPLPE